MSSKKNSKTSNAGNPPRQGAPAVPAGEAGGLSRREASRLHHPLSNQISLAAQAAKELASKSYRDDFGKHAPDPAALAQKIATSGAWSAEQRNAEAWATYVKKEEQLSWDDALVLAADLKDPFDIAADNDTTIAVRYQAVMALLAARSDLADEGVVTRKSNKKKAAKAAKP